MTKTHSIPSAHPRWIEADQEGAFSSVKINLVANQRAVDRMKGWFTVQNTVDAVYTGTSYCVLTVLCVGHGNLLRLDTVYRLQGKYRNQYDGT